MITSPTYRHTFERKRTGNESLSIVLCVDLECKTYCLQVSCVKRIVQAWGGRPRRPRLRGQSKKLRVRSMRAIPQSETLMNQSAWRASQRKGFYLRRSLPSESRSSVRAYDNCLACARSRALATTKFATGCMESFLRLRSKYVVHSMPKTGSGQRETRVSRRWEDVGSRRSVTR